MIENSPHFLYIEHAMMDAPPPAEFGAQLPITFNTRWTLSSAGSEHRPYKAGVAGSNPAASTR